MFTRPLFSGPLKSGILPTTPAHTALGVLLALVLPAASWLDGSGRFAWTMFSKSASYRLEIDVVDAGGARRAVEPGALAARAGPSARPFLSGARYFRHAPVASTFRHHLAEVGSLACAEPGAVSVEISLFERPTLDADVRETHAAITCPR
jgi:hypothetical protein